MWNEVGLVTSLVGKKSKISNATEDFSKLFFFFINVADVQMRFLYPITLYVLTTKNIYVIIFHSENFVVCYQICQLS